MKNNEIFQTYNLNSDDIEDYDTMEAVIEKLYPNQKVCKDL